MSAPGQQTAQQCEVSMLVTWNQHVDSMEGEDLHAAAEMIAADVHKDRRMHANQLQHCMSST